MLVYRDTVSDCRLASLIDICLQVLNAARAPDLDRLRTLLIVSGQVEQAIDDFDGEWPTADPELLSRELSDEAARAFYLFWSGEAAKGQIRNSLAIIESRLQALEAFGSQLVCVRMPEGFAFYCLYPEQYCVSASKWKADHGFSNGGRVLVVGIRSIGTSLSAVVRAALQANGWNVDRITVRPTGPPFHRRIEQTPLKAYAATPALVVDEGPGLSGSSMAAVAKWLMKAGFPLGLKHFLRSACNTFGASSLLLLVRNHLKRYPRRDGQNGLLSLRTAF